MRNLITDVPGLRVGHADAGGFKRRSTDMKARSLVSPPPRPQAPDEGMRGHAAKMARCRRRERRRAKRTRRSEEAKKRRSG